MTYQQALEELNGGPIEGMGLEMVEEDGPTLTEVIAKIDALTGKLDYIIEQGEVICDRINELESKIDEINLPTLGGYEIEGG